MQRAKLESHGPVGILCRRARLNSEAGLSACGASSGRKQLAKPSSQGFVRSCQMGFERKGATRRCKSLLAHGAATAKVGQLH